MHQADVSVRYVIIANVTYISSGPIYINIGIWVKGR